jgi:hypothetical protein
MGAREAIAKLLTGIKAYHSSPHDFDAFDLSKIGTGEGAQAYGHGIYSAESPKVSGQGGQYWNNFLNRFTGDEEKAASLLRAHSFDRDKAIADSAWNIGQIKDSLARGEFPDAAKYGSTRAYYEDLLRQREYQHQLLTSGAPVGPRTYELNIRSDPATMLNWDKTIEQQPNIWDRIPTNTRSHIDELYDQRGFNSISDAPEAYTGKDLYKALTHHDVNEGFPSFPGENWDNAKANASAFLDQVAGVPGIKYLDQGSRQHAANITNAENAYRQMSNIAGSAPEWEAELARLKQTPVSSNYVSFNPARDIDIMKKYGVIGAPAGALAADPAMMGSTYDQSQYPAEPP